MATRRYSIGNFLENQTTGGWFVGQFVPKHRLEYDRRIEVSVKILPKHWGKRNQHPRHYHRKAREIGIVTKGEATVEFDGQIFTLHRGDYYILNPGCVEKYLEVKEALELVTIKVPSLKDDKIKLE